MIQTFVSTAVQSGKKAVANGGQEPCHSVRQVKRRDATTYLFRRSIHRPPLLAQSLHYFRWRAAGLEDALLVLCHDKPREGGPWALGSAIIGDKVDGLNDTEALQALTGMVGGSDLHGRLGAHPRFPRGHGVVVMLDGSGFKDLCL